MLILCKRVFCGMIIFALLNCASYSSTDDFGLVESAGTLTPKSLNGMVLGKKY